MNLSFTLYIRSSKFQLKSVLCVKYSYPFPGHSIHLRKTERRQIEFFKYILSFEKYSLLQETLTPRNENWNCTFCTSFNL